MNLRKAAPLFALLFCAALPLFAETHAEAVFKRLQSLSGEWEGKDDHGMVSKTNFQVLASKTSVMETLSPAGMEEMVTLYMIDGDGIVLLHYCSADNPLI